MLAKEFNPGESPQLLFIDDEKDFQRFIHRNLTPSYEVVMADGWEQVKPMLKERRISPRIIFVEPRSQHNQPGFDLLQDIRSEQEGTPIVVISTQHDSATIVDAVKRGAREYLVKPFKVEKLQDTIERILSTPAAEAKVSSPRKGRGGGNPAFVYGSPAMERIHETVRLVADSTVPVLIHGESGVGKDVIARQIHAQSRVAGRNFVKVNCAALPPELAESELFGHTRGAFTGAVMDRPGKFEFASGGTIFLDEIGEFSPAAQAKLLQVLQEGRFTRLGSNEDVEVDVRVIAATNRNLVEAIEKKEFRADLYFRLNVVNILVPPLRERKQEIGLLCDHFLTLLAPQLNVKPRPLPALLRNTFQQYEWPGNVRELENVLKRFLVLGDAESIVKELASTRGQQTMQDVDNIVDEALLDLGQGVSLKRIAKMAAAKVERNLIASTLCRTNWNRLQAAKELRVSYKTLLTRIEEYKITP